MVRLLLGSESPEARMVAYDEKDLAKLDVAAVRRQIGTAAHTTRTP
jgi:ABC-type bacteriocin/lantibiotic exporter with double-glycine peptidase domain